MSASFIYYVDPVNGNVKVKTDLTTPDVHVQYLKLMDGRENSIAVIPGDATFGMFVQLPGVTKISQVEIYNNDGSDRVIPSGGVVLYDPQFEFGGASEFSYTPFCFDRFNRLLVQNSPLSGRVSAYRNDTVKMHSLIVQRAPIGIDEASGDSNIIAGVASNRLRILGIYLRFGGGADTFRLKDSGGNYFVGSASNGMPVAAGQDFAPPYCEHGLFETGIGEGLVMNLAVGSNVCGFILYVVVPTS